MSYDCGMRYIVIYAVCCFAGVDGDSTFGPKLLSWVLRRSTSCILRGVSSARRTIYFFFFKKQKKAWNDHMSFFGFWCGDPVDVVHLCYASHKGSPPFNLVGSWVYSQSVGDIKSHHTACFLFSHFCFLTGITPSCLEDKNTYSLLCHYQI